MNAFTDAVRRNGNIEWMHVRQEEAAAFAASGERQVSGGLVAVAGSCGPGTLHLITGLYDAHRSRVSTIAIATDIPLTQIGRGFFQETHDTRLFRECTYWCEELSAPDQLPRMIEMAVRAAMLQRGVAMIVVSDDVATMKAPAATRFVPAFVGSVVPPARLGLPDGLLRQPRHPLRRQQRGALRPSRSRRARFPGAGVQRARRDAAAPHLRTDLHRLNRGFRDVPRGGPCGRHPLLRTRDRRARAKGDKGAVTTEVTIHNQRGEPVLQGHHR